jgi:hypothetical protein
VHRPQLPQWRRRAGPWCCCRLLQWRRPWPWSWAVSSSCIIAVHGLDVLTVIVIVVVLFLLAAQGKAWRCWRISLWVVRLGIAALVHSNSSSGWVTTGFIPGSGGAGARKGSIWSMASSATCLAVELWVLGDDDMVGVEKIKSNYTKSKTLTRVLC